MWIIIFIIIIIIIIIAENSLSLYLTQVRVQYLSVSITSLFKWFNWFDWFNFFGLLVQQSNSWVWISNSQIMFSLMIFNYQTNWQSVKLFSNFSLGFVIFPGSTGEWNLNHCSWNDIFATNLYLFIYLFSFMGNWPLLHFLIMDLSVLICRLLSNLNMMVVKIARSFSD